MKAIYTILILTILAFVIPAEAQTQDWKSYTMSTFTVEYPSDWRWTNDTTARGTNVFTFHAPANLANVMFCISNDPALSRKITHLLQQPGYGWRMTEIYNNSYYLSGHPATRIIGIQHYGGPGESPLYNGQLSETKRIHFVAHFGNKTYYVSYTSTPQEFFILLPTAQQIIDSFQVTNGTTIGER